MRYPVVSSLRRAAAIAAVLLAAGTCNAQVAIFHDRATFLAHLGALNVLNDGYESYSPGPVAVGQVLGDFAYTFDAGTTQPCVVLGGSQTQDLGGPFDTFVGGDTVRLDYQPADPGQGTLLQAVGADFFYAPSGLDIPLGIYDLGIVDGQGQSWTAGNWGELDIANGGSFFLGLIAMSDDHAFTQIRIFSDPNNPDLPLVPGYQVDNLVYAPVPGEPQPVTPEPGAAATVGAMMLTSGGGFLIRRMRHHPQRP